MSKTAREIRSELVARGQTIPDWARDHGFPVRAVRAVIYGHNKGNYGRAHKIAVALGLKAVPE